MNNEPANILIVDDNHENLMLLSALLFESFNVIVASSGQEALDIVSHKKPDLILLDIMMPEMDGFEVCITLQNNEQTSDIPVIFLTAKSFHEDIMKGFAVGAVDYVTKPFNSSELLSRVSTHVDLKRSKDHIKHQNVLLKKEIEEKEQAEKALKESEAKFKGLITGLNEVVFRVNLPQGEYEYVSPAAADVFGYDTTFFKENKFSLQQIIHPEFKDYYKQKVNMLLTGEVAENLEYKIITNDGREKWIMQSNKGMFDNQNQIIAIEGLARDITKQKEYEQELKTRKEQLEIRNYEITSSIEYARIIQKAVLPSYEFFNQFLPDNFILFLPRDIVSGDFYWIKQVNDYVVFAIADCTGHGVPGGFMSMLGVAFLNEIVNYKEIPQADKILNQLREKVKLSLHQDRVRNTVTDGMDMALCVMDLNTKKLQFAGSNRPLLIVRNNNDDPQIEYIKGNRMPISVYINELPFDKFEVNVNEGDCLYLFSDGYIDQFGGSQNSKFKSKKFNQLLIDIHKYPMSEQKEMLKSALLEWKGNEAQVDDIIILGIRIINDYGNYDIFD